MPSMNDSQRDQAIKQTQSSVYDQNFDPNVVLQEIANKDVMLQMKEQELAQREQAAPPTGDRLSQALQLLTEEMQSREQPAPEATPVVPMQNQPTQEPSAPPQQDTGDVSPQTMKNVQPGQEIAITKRVVMTPNGPQEIGRTEKIKGQQQQG